MISPSKSADDYECALCGGIIKPGYRMVVCPCGQSGIDFGADYGRSGYISGHGHARPLLKQPPLTREATGGDQATERQTRGEEK